MAMISFAVSNASAKRRRAAAAAEATTRLPTQLSHTLDMIDRGHMKVGADLNMPKDFIAALYSVSGTVAVGSDDREYAVSETVAVYEVVNGEYQFSSLARISGGDYTLTGWYDKAENQGGCIRVIVAR